MNITQAAEAATMAANRSAYSLARELLGTRTALAETRTDRDGLAATLDEIGRLAPTDYQDRDELFRALLHILPNTPPGARARAEASALRRYAYRLHDKHFCRDHLILEADRIDHAANKLRREGQSA